MHVGDRGIYGTTIDRSHKEYDVDFHIAFMSDLIKLSSQLPHHLCTHLSIVYIITTWKYDMSITYLAHCVLKLSLKLFIS